MTKKPGSTTERRFAFGANWQRFSRDVDDTHIHSALTSMKFLLREDTLDGCSLLDIGCGAGLSSLAALKLGAKVTAFDYDADAVATTRALLSRHCDRGPWSVQQGSVLDSDFMKSLGTFDIVYSWGVLHHTGAMWDGLKAAATAVKPGGKLAIAIYNDQGGASARWLMIKRAYSSAPRPFKFALVLAVGTFFEVRAALIRLIRFQNPLPLADWKARRIDRGMSVWHDLVDWVGGYPFEVAKPEDMFEFLSERGFLLDGLKTCAGGHGCNEFLFTRPTATPLAQTNS